MSAVPSDRQLAVLRAVGAEGGFAKTVDDCEAAEQCAARAWLLAEDAEGYAVTMEGVIALRAAIDR